MSEVIVTLNCGKIKGIERENDNLFRGIPYATCERFEKPIEVTGFDGVFDATKRGSDCYQQSSFEKEDENEFYYKEFRSNAQFTYTENELVLNVSVPKSGKAMPTLLFVHGGGFETGTVGENPYGETDEYAKRGVIFVSVSYRLNAFAMYCDETHNGNLGLFDILCAVKWVKKNIASFGGDGERITVIGQSAGAMSLTDLCYYKPFEELISGAVFMSGGGAIPNVLSPLPKEKTYEYWKKVSVAAGAKNVEELKLVPPETLWRAWRSVSKENGNYRLTQPCIDGEIISDKPQNVLKSGKQVSVPYIFGVTSQDFLPVFLYSMALKWAREQSRKDMPPVYCYMFDRALPGNSFKAFHACDLWYMFGNMDKCWRPFEKIDYELSKTLIDYVANFAKSGNPNGDGLPNWQPTSYKNTDFLRLAETIEPISKRECRKKVWNTMLFDKGCM